MVFISTLTTFNGGTVDDINPLFTLPNMQYWTDLSAQSENSTPIPPNDELCAHLWGVADFQLIDHFFDPDGSGLIVVGPEAGIDTYTYYLVRKSV
jgi:hypothetical protein